MDLRLVAKRRGVTGRQIAATLGVTPSTVSRWLCGKGRVPHQYLRDLAAMLAIDPVDILPAPTRTPGAEQPTGESAG
jgi:transcriptional regulator with XRE-family HTH domain